MANALSLRCDVPQHSLAERDSHHAACLDAQYGLAVPEGK